MGFQVSTESPFLLPSPPTYCNVAIAISCVVCLAAVHVLLMIDGPVFLWATKVGYLFYIV